MKKIFLVFAIAMSSVLFSQEFKWGAIANVHSSSIEGIHDYSRGRIAPSVGLFAEIPMESFQRSIYSPLGYYIYPVIEYSMEGERALGEIGTRYFRNDFVALALYGKFHFYRGYFENFYFMVGPRFAYNVAEYGEGPILVYENGNIEPNFDIHKWNFSASLALGYVISDKMEIHIRYDQGFSKVYPHYDEHKTWIRMLGLGISYYFN